MIAVIFEVEPAPGRRDACLSIATGPRPMRSGVDTHRMTAARPTADEFFTLRGFTAMPALAFGES